MVALSEMEGSAEGLKRPTTQKEGESDENEAKYVGSDTDAPLSSANLDVGEQVPLDPNPKKVQVGIDPKDDSVQEEDDQVMRNSKSSLSDQVVASEIDRETVLIASSSSYEQNRSGRQRPSPESASGSKKLPRVDSLPSVEFEDDHQIERPRSSSAPPKEITTKISSGSMGSTSSVARKSGGALRRGKWTVEEEAYVARCITDFNSGYLDAPAGTTLRTFLSEKLQCDPMRITKKFTGDACIGKRVFHPAVRSPSNAAAIDKAQAELEALERRWRRRLELQKRESAKKAAASAAAAAAISGQGSVSGYAHDESSDATTAGPQNVVARTASWLDRAKSALSGGATQNVEVGEADALQNQMQEVQRLIHEGPIIQESSAGIPQMLDCPSDEQETISSPEPADKRMRTAEDAEALVGFLRSVRASAASGDDF